MKLFEYQTILPHPIEDVFALTVDLQKAPHWHSIFTNVKQITLDPIGLGSRWQVSYGMGGIEPDMILEIIDYVPPSRVVFEARRSFGMVPNFTIELQAVEKGTAVRYLLHPDIPSLLKPLMATFAVPYGRRDLDRYFRELDVMLARA